MSAAFTGYMSELSSVGSESLLGHLAKRGIERLSPSDSGVRHFAGPVHDDDIGRRRNLVRSNTGALVIVQRSECRLMCLNVATHPVRRLIYRDVDADEFHF